MKDQHTGPSMQVAQHEDGWRWSVARGGQTASGTAPTHALARRYAEMSHDLIAALNRSAARRV